MREFLAYMEKQGWTVEMNEEQEFCLPEPMKSRYAGYPESWVRFVSIVKSMVRKDERAWFLCAEDYDMQGDKAWQWNEWELLSLEAAENDTAWKDEIRKFWNGHLPIFLSLENGYAYYAISMKDGSIVYGAEPEFEECETVADSFEDFMEKVINGRIQLTDIVGGTHPCGGRL